MGWKYGDGGRGMVMGWKYGDGSGGVMMVVEVW